MKHIINYFALCGSFMSGELKRISRDAGAILILAIAAFLYPAIYSFAYQKEVLRDLPVAVVDLCQSNHSRTLAKMVDGTDELKVTLKATDMEQARKAFHTEEVQGIILIDPDFSKAIAEKTPAVVKVFADGSYFLFYKQILSGGIISASTFGAGVEIQRMMASGKTMDQAMDYRDPIPLKTQELHNPFGGYGGFVMPGLIIVVLQQLLIVGLGMMGGTTSENKNHFFLGPEKLTNTHVSAYVLGRAIAYLILFLINGVIALVWIHNWFNFPDHGALLDVLTLYIPFILAVTFLGIAVATLFRHREEAFMLIVFLSPLILFLSGISWPKESIPHILYGISHLFPSNFMIPAYLRIRSMGATIPDVSYELTGLLIQTGVYSMLAFWATKVQIGRVLERNKKNEPSTL